FPGCRPVQKVRPRTGYEQILALVAVQPAIAAIPLPSQAGVAPVLARGSAGRPYKPV
ncbi:uncharacterized protein PgNI_08540, partial [Pyricularia grisea]|uniref:Uncharacterized protein n=1 Tax=Pyricularia grisea TaxID=148305 RepID=A0A6P8AWF5_PYRGI